MEDIKETKETPSSDVANIPDEIRKLKKNIGRFSIAKQIEMAFDDIEECKDMGMSDSQILNYLKSVGITVKSGTFRTVMSRIRLQRKKQKDIASEETHPSPASEDKKANAGISKPTQPPKTDQNKRVEAAQGGSSETGKAVLVEKSQNPVPPRNPSTFQKPRPFDRITDREPEDLF